MYIPDLTERYPEGFRGPDVYDPYDIEYDLWESFEKQFEDMNRESEETEDVK